MKKKQHESQDIEKLQSNMIEIKINVNKLLFFIIFISFSFIMSNELNFSARNIDNRKITHNSLNKNEDMVRLEVKG